MFQIKHRKEGFKIVPGVAARKSASTKLFYYPAGCYNVSNKSAQFITHERNGKLAKVNYQYEKRQKELEKKKKKEQKLRRKEIKKSTQQPEETPVQTPAPSSEKKETPPA